LQQEFVFKLIDYLTIHFWQTSNFLDNVVFRQVNYTQLDVPSIGACNFFLFNRIFI